MALTLLLLIGKSIMSRSEAQIKRNKKETQPAANDVRIVQQPSETTGGFSMVLAKKSKRFREKETIRWLKKKKEILAALEGGTGRLTQRREQRRESVFIFPLAFSILFHFHPATSITLFSSLTFPPVLFSPSRVVVTRLFISNVWHFAPCHSPERTH